MEGTAGVFLLPAFFLFFFEHNMELTYPQIMTLCDHLSMKGSCLVLFLKNFSFIYPWSQGYCCLPPSVPTLIYFVKVKVDQSCLTLCDPMDFFRNSPGQNTGVGSLSLLPRDWTQVSHIADGFFTSWATRKAQYILYISWNMHGSL